MPTMTLDELVRNTDALTYLNALKVTLTSVKDQFSEMEEHATYINNRCEETRKLIRRADNQYRLLAKLVQKDAPLTSNITISDALTEIPNVKELMEQND